MDGITQALLPIAASICAGLVYNTLGIWKKYRSGRDVDIDWAKVGKNVVIGIGTGIAARIYEITTNSTIVPITSFEGFVLAAGAAFGAVVAVEAIFTKDSSDVNE